MSKVIVPVATEYAKKYTMDKLKELTMTDAQRAEKEINATYDKLKKQTDIAIKKESIRKMKLDNDAREKKTNSTK